MFVEIRKIGKDRKYYLVHSFREGKDVAKIRKYLGLNLSHTELKQKKELAEASINEQLHLYKEIRDPLRYVLSPTELRQIKNLEARGRIKVRHLSEDQWRRFSEIFSYHTNAIEGSTLTLKEVTALIEKDKVPKKSLADVEEARGVVDAVKYIRKTKEPLSLKLIKKLHRIVFKKTKDFAGQFRPSGIEVIIRNAEGIIVHRGAPSEKIKPLVQELVQWYKKHKNIYSGILLAALVHNQIENIHPFQDGNGRVGRLIIHFILIKHHLPPVNIELHKRQDYYQALQAYQKQGNIRPMIELIMEEYRHIKKLLKR